MKKLLLLPVMLLIIFACAAFMQPQAKPDFAGNWEWVKNSEAATFSLELKQKGNELTGSYCAVANSGNRIDCGMDEGDACKVTGTINGNMATVKYTSCYSGKTATATITYLADKERMLWEGKPTSAGYVPVKAELKRQ